MTIKKFIRAILALGQRVIITFYHFPIYPVDDIAFLLCAENGQATHIISYDRHLRAIDHFYTFQVCDPLTFLIKLREELDQG